MPARALRTAVATAMLLVAATTTTGCQQHASPSPPALVRLGALLPLSGRNAPTGMTMAAGARLAVQDINNAGGVLGHRLDLTIADDACDPATAVTAANTLISHHILVSVGGACSSATVATLRTFRNATVPMIIPASNSADLLTPGYDSVFLLSGTVDAEAHFAMQQLRRLHRSRLAVVHDATSFPATLAAASRQHAATMGITTVADLELSQGAPSYTRAATEILAAGADVVYYTGYHAEAHQLIIDLRAAGYSGTIIIGDGAIGDQTIGNLTDSQSADLYGTSLPLAELVPDLAAWWQRFQATTDTAPGPGAVEAYDAVRLAADAIRRAGSLDRQAIRAAIAATADLAMGSGPVRFNPDGTRINPTFLLLAVRNHTFTLANADDPAR